MWRMNRKFSEYTRKLFEFSSNFPIASHKGNWISTVEGHEEAIWIEIFRICWHLYLYVNIFIHEWLPVLQEIWHTILASSCLIFFCSWLIWSAIHKVVVGSHFSFSKQVKTQLNDDHTHIGYQVYGARGWNWDEHVERKWKIEYMYSHKISYIPVWYEINEYR